MPVSTTPSSEGPPAETNRSQNLFCDHNCRLSAPGRAANEGTPQCGRRRLAGLPLGPKSRRLLDYRTPSWRLGDTGTAAPTPGSIGAVKAPSGPPSPALTWRIKAGGASALVSQWNPAKHQRTPTSLPGGPGRQLSTALRPGTGIHLRRRFRCRTGAGVPQTRKSLPVRD